MTNNLQGDDDAMPALVSAGEDVPSTGEGDKEEESSEGVTSGNKVHATFVWYQFSQDVADPATLLSSEKVNNGSVELYLDSSGEFFGSSSVLVEKGTHEGQLCYKYSDGYEEMYPIKPFEVERENDAIILALDVQRRRAQYGTSQYSGSQYGTSQYSGSQYGTSQYSGSQYGTSQYSGSQYGTYQRSPYLLIYPATDSQGQQGRFTLQPSSSNSQPSSSTIQPSSSSIQHIQDEPYRGQHGRRGRDTQNVNIRSNDMSHEIDNNTTGNNVSTNLARSASTPTGNHSNTASNLLEHSNSVEPSHQPSTSPSRPMQAASDDTSDLVEVLTKRYEGTSIERLEEERRELEKDIAREEENIASSRRERVALLAKQKHISAQIDEVQRNPNATSASKKEIVKDFEEHSAEVQMQQVKLQMTETALRSIQDQLTVLKSIIRQRMNRKPNGGVSGEISAKGRSPVTSGQHARAEATARSDEVLRLQYKVQSLESEVEQLKSFSERQQREYHQELMLLRQGHSLSEGGAAVAGDVSHLQDTVFSLRSSLEEARKEKEQMSQVIRGNCEKIASLERAIQTKQSYINAQKEGIQEKEDHMRKLEHQISYFREEHEALQQKLDGYKDMVSKYDTTLRENEDLKKHMQALGNGVDVSVLVAEGRTSQQMGEGAEGWEEEKRRLEDECLSLKQQLEMLKEESATSSSGQQSEGDVIQQLQDENMQLNDKLEVVRAQCASSEEALTQADMQLDKLKEETACIRLEVEEEGRRAEDACRQAGELRVELDGKDKELASLNAELVRCQASMERELADVKHEKETLLTEIAELRSLSQHPTHYQELKEENAELKENKEKLVASLEKERQMNMQLKEKSRELQQQLAMATDEERLQAVQRKVQEYKRERDQLRQENEKLQLRMQGLQQTQDLIQGHLVQFNTVKEQMERYREERDQAQMEQEKLAEENARIKRLYQESHGEIPPVLVSSPDLGEKEEESTNESLSDVVAMVSTEGTDTGEWKALEDSDDNDSSEKGKRGGTKAGHVQEKMEQGAARAKLPQGQQPEGSPKIGQVVGMPEGSDVSPSQQNVITVVTSEGKIPCTHIHKGQQGKLGNQVLVKRNAGYDWGKLRYLPGEKDKEDFAGVELTKPTGKHNGFHEKKKKQYFKCQPNYGLFTPLKNVYLPLLGEETYQF